MKLISKLIETALFKVIQREYFRFLSSRVLPFSTLLAPALAFLLIMWIFSAGVLRDIPVVVVDNDNTSLSHAAVRAIDASPVADVIRMNSLYEARKMMDKGKTAAIVCIDKDFEKNILKASEPGVAVFINNTNIVKGGALKSGIYKSLATVSAGIKVQTLMKKGENEYRAREKVQPVKLDTHLLFNPFGNYSYFLVLALLPLMVNVFTFLGSVYAIGIELKEGTAGEWFKTANNSIIVALTGKMLPYTLLYLVNVMFMNILLFRVLGTPLHGSLLVILFSEFLLVITYQLLAILVLSITSNMRLSLSLGSAYTMMALTFSGLTFPTIAMPLAAKLFSLVFPYTFWIKLFLSQTLRGEPLVDTAVSFLFFVIFILGGILAFPRMKKLVSDRKYWYRT
jgi:ABC-2 type transport system permease protein